GSEDASKAIEVLDNAALPVTPAEQLTIGRSAYASAAFPRAAQAFATGAAAIADPLDRYRFGVALQRTNRQTLAAAQFALVPAASPLGPMAMYQRGRAVAGSGN